MNIPKEAMPRGNPDFEDWITAFAQYLKTRNTTTNGEMGTDYSGISLSDIVDNHPLWSKFSNEPLDRYITRLQECLARAIPASLDEIPRSATTPIWLCSKKLHNGSIPIPEGRRWRCNNLTLGQWLWYGWYIIVSPLFPECDAEFVPRLSVYGVSDWGHTLAILEKIRPPMFHNDEEVLQSARRSADSGSKIARTAAAAACELSYEKLHQDYGDAHKFVKWSYADWSTVATIDSKVLPQAVSLNWDISPGGAGEIYANALRLVHDIVDYAADVAHNENSNTRVQHDLSCSITGCIWSELNRLAAQLEGKFGQLWIKHFFSAMFWWHITIGRYHVMPKLCYAARHCKIPTPTDCPWTGFAAHPVALDIPQIQNPVSRPEACRGPCIEIGACPKDFEEAFKSTETVFQQIFDPEICYDCILKVSDHLEGSYQQLPPAEGMEFFLQNTSRFWEGPILSLFWKSVGHMCGVVAAQGSHDEKTCIFT
ncbi:hypothetical protein TWF718_007947 [Orbilia javanica]|uniref:Uncharacterized protein n=1 Tax=Orbilia javanica TaxID=47235 RepID=A0AAN8MVK4_9PEZI